MATYEQEERKRDQEARDFARSLVQAHYERTEITNLKAVVKRYRKALQEIVTAEDVCNVQRIAIAALRK